MKVCVIQELVEGEEDTGDVTAVVSFTSMDGLRDKLRELAYEQNDGDRDYTRSDYSLITRWMGNGILHLNMFAASIHQVQ